MDVTTNNVANHVRLYTVICCFDMDYDSGPGYKLYFTLCKKLHFLWKREIWGRYRSFYANDDITG